MPNLLFIDTSGPLAAVALLKGKDNLRSLYHEDPKSQAAELNLLINSVLEKCDLSFHDLDAICVCAGPGSYTGLRVGLSTAKGIAFAADLKVLLFDKLQLINFSFSDLNNKQDKLVVLNARKHEYFYALFGHENKFKHVAKHAFEEDLIEFANRLNKNTYLITDQEDLSLGLKKTIINASFKINIFNWAKLAEERVVNEDWDDLAYSEPFYLKEAYLTKSKNKSII